MCSPSDTSAPPKHAWDCTKTPQGIAVDQSPVSSFFPPFRPAMAWLIGNIFFQVEGVFKLTHQLLKSSGMMWDYPGAGTVVVQGLSRHREHRGVGTMAAWGASWHGHHHGEGPSQCVWSPWVWGAPLWQPWKFLGKGRKAGKRLREQSEPVRGGGDTADKIRAASQAVLGEAQQSFAGAKTT